MVSGFNTLSGIMRTVLNQYESLVMPLRKWLEEHGVRFSFNAQVSDLSFLHGPEGYAVERIFYERDGHPDVIKIAEK